jgi:RNA polymerase-binding transcription factor DksA
MPKSDSSSASQPAKKSASAPAAAGPAPVRRIAKAAPSRPAPPKAPVSNGVDHGAKAPSKDGIVATRDFDLTFLRSQKTLLEAARANLSGQADRLEDEARSLIEDGEMGDVQFDDESGEGDTMVVERERDLVLSASARHDIGEIDAAIARLSDGTYGYSLVSGEPIPRERLEFIPWATELVGEKVGWLGRR